MGAIEQAWNDVDSSTATLIGLAKRASTLALRANAASAEGSASGVTKNLDGLAVELDQLIAGLAAARTALHSAESLLASPNALAQEVETELRSHVEKNPVWRVMSEVVAFPVVANIRAGKVVVDRATLNSQRPGIVIGAILAALKAGTSPEKFLKSLHTAAQLVDGRPGSRVPLASIHQVLATMPPGGGTYSPSDFRVDLQWLYASGLRSVGGSTVKFEVASAGPTAVPVFDQHGNLVNLGYVSFETAAGTDV